MKTKKLLQTYRRRDSLQFKGWVKIWKNNELIFDKSNLIVTQGKGFLMDWLSSIYTTLSYTPSAFNALILTKNTTAVALGDTFASKVFGGTDYISDDGVLHMEAGGFCTIDHTQGSLTMEVTGTLSEAYGNDPSNNHINSIALCSGVNASAGGAGQAAYSATANEMLFARVAVGDLVKTSSESYSFSWVLSVV